MSKFQKGRDVSLKTFLSWPPTITENFGYKEEYDPRRQDSFITHVYCKVCAENRHILRRLQHRGQASTDVMKYVTGTNFIMKFNLRRHVDGNAHKFVLQHMNDNKPLTQTGECSSSITSSYSVDNSNSKNSVTHVGLPRIDMALNTSSKEAYFKLFNTAYNIVVNGKPFVDFQYIIDIQKENGVRLLKGKQNDKLCASITQFIATSILNRIGNTIKFTATAFSILNDGSQPKKTGTDLELIYIRILNERTGLPCYFCVSLQELAAYGGGDAESIKHCIDDAFLNKLSLDTDMYRDKCVCITADGASVNTGKYNGVFSRFSYDRPWILSIHCVAHRAELSAKDAFNSSVEFKEIEEFYYANYSLLKNSGKLNSELKAACVANDITYYKLPKIHGTRFQHHKREGFKRLIHMWIPLHICYENASMQIKGYTPETRAKIKGFLKKLERYDLITALCTYSDILESLGHLTKLFEKEHILAFDVTSNVSLTKETLNELLHVYQTTDNVEQLNSKYFEIVQNGESYKLRKLYCRLGDMRKNETNREYKYLELSNIKNVDKSVIVSQKITTQVIPKLNEAYVKRFESFNNHLYKAMTIFDPQNWDLGDTASLRKYGCHEIDIISAHFSKTLALQDYKHLACQVEWRELKLEVKSKFLGKSCIDLWQMIFLHKRSKYVNLCKLVEIILCLSVSNCTVERGFSYLTHTLSDRRLALNHKNLEAYIVVRNNHAIWSETEKTEILQDSVHNYLSCKRRVTTMDNATTEKVSSPKSKRLCVVTDSDLQSELSDSSSSSNDSLSDEDDHISAADGSMSGSMSD